MMQLSTMAESAPTGASPPATLHRRVWLTGETAVRDVVICLHGIESHADWFDELAAALNDHRMDVVAFDRHGFGRSGGRRGDAVSIASLLTEIDQVRAALGEYQRLHVVGLSWGGLLATAALIDDPSRFATATLIAPALVTKRELSPWALVTAGLSLLTGGRLRVALPIRPEDFTARADRLAYIEQDPLRTRAVSGRFLWLTLLLQRRVRTALTDAKLPPTQICLAGVEPLVDNAAIRHLTRTCRIDIKDWPTARHSLVFEAPRDVAAAIATLARTRGVP